MTTYRVLGLEKLTAALQAFPAELVKQSLNKALMKGAVLIRDECRRRAPVGPTGKLEGSIIAIRDKRPELSGFQAGATVFAKYKGAGAALSSPSEKYPKGEAYWRFVEFGTARMGAKPFMRPAFETQKVQALAVIIDSIAADVPRIAKSLGGA